MRSPHTATKSRPYPLQQERAMYTNEDSAQSKINDEKVLKHYKRYHEIITSCISILSSRWWSLLILLVFFPINISIYLHISEQWAYAVILDSSVVYVIHSPPTVVLGLPCPSDSKESACNAKDVSLIPGLGRSPREGKGYPLQYSCLEISMGRGGWWVIFHGVTELDTTEWLTL